MDIKFICPYWGQEGSSPTHFFKKVMQADYDGIEINIPDSIEFVKEFQVELERIRDIKPGFFFIAQQVLSPRSEPVAEYINRMKVRFDHLILLKPDLINSHTGKDYFSFDENCKVIDVVENISQRSGVRVFHETHRGRFTFHMASLLPYLDRFPNLKLTADFSHWCTVSESMLSDQQDTLDRIIPYIYHLHARIGYEQSPQVNDPFAPEWKTTLKAFFNWWGEIVNTRKDAKDVIFTICPEFGPVPYMPTMPTTQKPLGDQWDINLRMKKLLKNKFNIIL